MLVIFQTQMLCISASHQIAELTFRYIDDCLQVMDALLQVKQ